ncbi:hypothetical protein NPIL_440761 [Nephila pilipes]|uniref:Uncharacterized protein n=1 Tax=Nephila pilipes TaxID=299642 RepID=A0A8X6ND59_NEPPI|nr:hypothetical protein NPIL_440761 [Nephila pilipes]
MTNARLGMPLSGKRDDRGRSNFSLGSYKNQNFYNRMSSYETGAKKFCSSNCQKGRDEDGFGKQSGSSSVSLNLEEFSG